MNKNLSALLVIGMLAIACKNNSAPVKVMAQPAYRSEPAPNKYTMGMVTNKIDFSCRMPLTAGIADTCHFQGKAYGFCSIECKESFIKDPAAYLKGK